jgi:hypothetical protein
MTTDTEKLAADIKRVMELAAKAGNGSEWLYTEGGQTKEDNDLAEEAPLMADIIRRQQEVIRKLDDALSITQAAGYFRGHLGDMAEATIGEARRLAAPLVKEV